MQKSLQGLDNITSEGTEALENIMEIVKTLLENGAEVQWGQNVKLAIKEAKRYLKTDFKAHVGREEHCSDHCTVHSLSYPDGIDFKDECQHDHSQECERCESLEKLIKDVQKAVDDVEVTAEQRARIMFEYTDSIHSIHAWKAHLLRSINQEEAKQDALSKLDDETCLIVMDWAMKFLPQHYREQMSEFFGKRGRSWHISAVITKLSEKYEVECFVHIFNSCIQNSFAVASVIEHLLCVIKQECPLISKAFLRSDNAGCYHNGPLLLSLPGIGQRSGVKILRYDFSDPQAGKDICDRKTAPMKAHIKRWVNEKHDVITAEDMKQAVESHGGIKGCRAAVVEVDSTKDIVKDNKIPGISLLNNFSFEETRIRAWKAYNIGPGKLFTYDAFLIRHQENTGLKVIQPFGTQIREKGTVGESSRKKSDIFSCKESGCVLTFKTEAEVEAHMDTARHRLELESESLYDSIRKKWAGRVTGITSAGNRPHAPVVDQEHPTVLAERRPAGWALKVVKKPSRMTEKVKEFLVEKFQTGARSGKKADPVQVAKEIKFAKDNNGKPLFSPDEWRTAQQISYLFSRLSAGQRQRQTEEQIPEEDLAAIESEIAFVSLRNAVFDDIDTPIHPIMVGTRDICDLLHAGKLSSLKIVELQKICEEFQLEVNGRPTRKKYFLEPLETYVKTCKCFQD